MKHFSKLVFIVPVIVFLGFGLLIGGSVSSNDAVAKVGQTLLILIVPIAAIFAVGVGLAGVISGKGNDKSGQDTQEKSEDDGLNDIGKDVSVFGTSVNTGEKEQELEKLQDINNSYGRESQIKQEAYMASQSVKIYKNASKSEKIKTWLFLGLLLADFALIFIFGYFHIYAGVIACTCIFGGTIIVCMIVKKISEKLSMRKIDVNSNKYEILRGEVKASFLSSSASSGGGSRNSTVRIRNVVYRVVIRANAQEYTAYSKEYYESGTPVVFAAIGKKRAAIVDEEKFAEKFAEKFDDDVDNTNDLTF